MIVSFRMKNFGPFRDETVVDFRSTKLKDTEDNLLSVDKNKTRILSGLAMFGPNASGKSYVIRALGSLTNIMRFPLPTNIPIASYMPFAFSKNHRNSSVELGIKFIDKEILYDYNIEFDSLKIISESLFYSPNGQRSKVFVRKGKNYSCMRTNGMGLGKLTSVTSDNSSFISVAAQFNNEICKNAVIAISKIIILSGDMNNMLNAVIRRMNTDEKFRTSVLDALTIADFGIDNIDGRIETKNVTEMSCVFPPQLIGLMMATGNNKVDHIELRLRHMIGDDSISESERYLPYEVESNGTIRMLCVIGPVIDVLNNGGMIAIDEFGAFMHHDLCVYILNLFKNEINRNKAQILVNTHNLNLIDTDILRRDQMILVSKERETCASELIALSDYGIHKGTDILKAYKNGQFGSLPIIGNRRLLHES